MLIDTCNCPAYSKDEIKNVICDPPVSVIQELSTCMAILHALERFTAMVGHTLGQRNASVLHSSYFAGGLGKLL